MAALSHIFLSTSRVTLDRSPGAGKLTDLKTGQVLQARVIEVVSPQRAMLQIRGQQVSAQTHMPLKAGETISLKVVENGALQVLRLVSPSGQGGSSLLQEAAKIFSGADPFNALIRLLEQPGLSASSASGDLMRLKTLVAAMALRSETPEPQLLKDIVRSSGLVWEQKMAMAVARGETADGQTVQRLAESDLKALALSALNALPEHDTRLKPFLQKFSDGLEILQRLNQHLLGTSGRFFLPLPVLFPETLKFGQMLIDLGQKRRSVASQAGVVRVSFLLEMTQLGNLRADFSILDQSVTGAFGVSDSKTASFIRQHLEQLSLGLQRLGFQVMDVSVQVLAPETLAGTALMDPVLAARAGGFNVVI
jgi:hypothetical protein